MAGDTNGAEEALAAQGAQAADDAQEKQQAEVSGGSGNGANGGVDYERAIGKRDARIAELEAQVAEAAKSAETTDELRAQIAEHKAQGESDRIDFRLRLAGARNLKAARAVLADHDGDVEALVAAEPWLFSQARGASNKTSRNIGATGMEPAGVAGGSAERDIRRWERIAGLTEEEV